MAKVYAVRRGCVFCCTCIHVCPAGAITREGHDKTACGQYIRQALKPWEEFYGIPMIACGLCQTGVPCEARIP